MGSTGQVAFSQGLGLASLVLPRMNTSLLNSSQFDLILSRHALCHSNNWEGKAWMVCLWVAESKVGPAVRHRGLGKEKYSDQSEKRKHSVCVLELHVLICNTCRYRLNCVLTPKVQKLDS